MLHVPKRFVDDTLWPEYVELSKALQETLERATDQVLKVVFEQETTDAEVREEPRAIGPGGPEQGAD